MRPALRQLQDLIAIVDTGKFGEAVKRMNVSQPSHSVQMADMGGGVAILPSLYVLSEATRDPYLKIRKMTSEIAERDIHLCWRPSSPLTKKFQVLGETMAEVADRMISSSGSKT